MVLCGADRIEEYSSIFKDARVGLVTTPTGRRRDGVSTADYLMRECRLTVLFGPEHGIRGDIEDAANVPYTTDTGTKLPVYSLYEGSRRRMTQEMLDLFDVIVYDIQDVGSRYYTFISSLYNVMQDISGKGKRLVVLDRPNPLGGDIIEGNIIAESEYSFVGCYSMTERYALTAGEFAEMVKDECGLDIDLIVIPCSGWSRSMLFNETGIPWIMPSPNMPSFETAIIYVGTCLFEGTNVSEGRGSANPFQLIGAPYIKEPEKLARAFNNRKPDGLCATPYYFKPYTSKHAGQNCGGIHIHVTDKRAARPLEAVLNLIEYICEAYPDDFRFLDPPSGGKIPFIRLLTGLDCFERGIWKASDIIERMHSDEELFLNRKKDYHIYK